MFRKFLACFLFLILLFSCAFSEKDRDVTIIDLIENVPEDFKENISYDEDGAVIMTITCTGDFTIGGDNYHKKNKFYEQGSSKPNYVFMLVDSDNVKFSPWEIEDEEKVYTEEEVTNIIKGVISDCESGNGDACYCMNRIGEYLYYNY